MDFTLPSSREECVALDCGDPLRSLRDAFVLPPDVVYLDGNSLGPLPRATAPRLARAVAEEWGEGLIRSWNTAGWVDLPTRVGAKIASLVGAEADEVVVADSTSINLYKVLSTALALRGHGAQAKRRRTDSKEPRTGTASTGTASTGTASTGTASTGTLRTETLRTEIISEQGNFPTDLYIAQGLARQLGDRHRLRLVARDEIESAIGDETAVVMLTQVDYRTGSRLDMSRITRGAHDAGALVVWDLAHSAGAFPVSLGECDVDFAVGCGYKYLNGGPGAPAFLYVARRWQSSFSQPLSGWFGHRAPFAFEPDYRPAPGVARYLCGTPPVLSTIALECGVDTVLAAQPLGGLAALEAKAGALTDLFIAQVEARCARHGLALVTPRGAAQRGNQVSFATGDATRGYALMQALIARGVIGDFRAPDVLRFGFAPLYCRYVDAWDAAAALEDVLERRSWDQPRFHARQAVT